MLSRTITSLLVLLSLVLLSCTAAVNDEILSRDGSVPILGTLSGDLPVSALTRLPEGQRDLPVGCLTNPAQLDAVLLSIQAEGRTLPPVDYSTQIVLFARNTVYYNRLSIGQVLRAGETLTIQALETRSARPIVDRVAISLAVIEQNGAQYINAGHQRLVIND